jgi:predicted nucleotide-binding protein
MPTSRNARTESSRPERSRRQVFVAYSYRLYPKADYRNIYKEIEKSYDVTFIFADEKITNMHIMKKIESFIRNSDFSVFDISGWNPNVTLELGFSMALNDQWYIALDPSKTEVKEVPSDLRGLDRIEYSSYAELRAKLETVVTQRYPKRPPGTIETYLEEQRKHVIGLLKNEPGLSVTGIAQVLGVEVGVAKLVVRPLVESNILRTEGRRKATKYFPSDSEPPNEQPKPPQAPKRETKRAAPQKSTSEAASEEIELNDKQHAVLMLLRKRRVGMHLEEIGAACFRNQSSEKANSWTRNSLRKLVEHSLVRKTGRGIYVAT